MAMDTGEIERMIKEALPDAEIVVQNLADDGVHFSATILSSAFEGKNRVQQHQMVYAALKGRMGNEVHALSLSTGLPQGN